MKNQRALMNGGATVVVFGLLVAGCSKDKVEAKPETQAAEAESAEDSRLTEPAKQVKGDEAARTALASYERLRASLAKDELSAVSKDAAALERAAKDASAKASGEVKQQWGRVAEAAKQLSDLSKEDADAVRKAFGDVSEHMLAVLKADGALAEGLHVFECPMAKGYKKWVQPGAEISNPYMGTRMPKCGSESSL